jgi:hypothetical protein
MMRRVGHGRHIAAIGSSSIVFAHPSGMDEARISMLGLLRVLMVLRIL